MSEPAAPLCTKLTGLASSWLGLSVIVGIVVGFVVGVLFCLAPILALVWLAIEAILHARPGDIVPALLVAAVIAWLIVRDPVP